MTEKICSEGRDHGYSCCPEHGSHKMRWLGGHTRGCPDREEAAPIPLHVVPVADAAGFQHDLDEDCLCGPTFDTESRGLVVVHHSLDGREFEGR